MTVAGLADALVDAGFRFTVEEQGKLAVLVPTTSVNYDARTRRAIVALARAHGFANVCIEIQALDAAVPGN